MCIPKSGPLKFLDPAGVAARHVGGTAGSLIDPIGSARGNNDPEPEKAPEKEPEKRRKPKNKPVKGNGLTIDQASKANTGLQIPHG